MTIRLELEGVGFTYPDGTRALDGVSFRVDAGECVALIGQNGSGKSTLVRHLVGLLRPTEGRVVVGGVDAADLRVAQLASRVGLAFQDPDRQIFAGRVRAEVAFGPANLGAGGADLVRAVDDALRAVGLDADADANPYDLGHSRRRLLGVASILAMRTPAVVLDEPTTGQDARGIARIRDIVAGLTAERRTVVAVSHDMQFVAETFARVVVLRAGRVILDGSPAEVFAEANGPLLTTTHLEPPVASRVGARLGLGSTPTEASLVEAMRRLPSAG